MEVKDWRFEFLGFPVRVELWFWLVAAILPSRLHLDLSQLVIWVGVVFVSILVHELGHALVGRHFGLRPEIALYSMGGVTRWQSPRGLRPTQNILISFAGPFAGFALAAIVLLVSRTLPLAQIPLLADAVWFLLWVNVLWGVLNLCPMLPLDGGNVMRSVVHSIRGVPDEALPLKISISVGALAALLAFFWGQPIAAFLACWMTYTNYKALQQLGANRWGPRY